MKRLVAVIVALLLICAMPIFPVTTAAAEAKLGELLITSEKVTGAVGDVVKVNFYLYANLPENRKLDTLTASMRYDPDVVKLGAVNQTDEENNLTSFMKGKASMFTPNIEENGVLKFVFIDGYGVEANGFWFQAEFRIESEGSTDFVFNSLSYTGIDSSLKTETYYIEPVSVGGIFTEGQEKPENGPVEETFAPLTPAVDTPKPVTPTPKPSNSSKPVPVTTKLPTYSAKPAPSGIVTPGPAVTSIPVSKDSDGTNAATQAPETNQQNTETTPEAGTDPVAEIPGAETTEAPAAVIETTPAPNREAEGTEQILTSQQGGSTDTVEGEEGMNLPLVIGVIAGLVVVVALGVVAIVLVLKRRNASDTEDDEEDEYDEDDDDDDDDDDE